MVLNLIYPATNYVKGGTPTDIPLWCNSGGNIIKSNLQKVTLKITTNPSFTVQEVVAWDDEGTIYATKIRDYCSGAVWYVANYITDVDYLQNCCCTNCGNDTNVDVWIDFDLEEVEDFDEQFISYL